MRHVPTVLLLLTLAPSFIFLAAVRLPSDETQAQSPRPRARDLGLQPGVFPPGALNAITDVAGVRVGHTTLIEGENDKRGRQR